MFPAGEKLTVLIALALAGTHNSTASANRSSSPLALP
jgi:hypothetical protein